MADGRRADGSVNWLGRAHQSRIRSVHQQRQRSHSTEAQRNFVVLVLVVVADDATTGGWWWRRRRAAGIPNWRRRRWRPAAAATTGRNSANHSPHLRPVKKSDKINPKISRFHLGKTKTNCVKKLKFTTTKKVASFF